MKYYVSIGDMEYGIELTEEKDGLKCRTDDKVYAVDHAEIEKGAKYSVLIGTESFNVSLDYTGSNMDLIVGGHLYHAEVMDERERGAKALEKIHDLKGPHVLKSIMPGIVIKVFVEEGQIVSAGDPLLVLEAMKMENELKAEKEGIVTKVHVTEGQTVNSSDPLVTTE